MTTLTAALVLAKQDLPAGMVPGLFEITLSTAGAADVVQTTDQTTVTFADLAAGDYVVTAVRLADSGERISAPVTASIRIEPPVPDQVDVPASITLTLG
jgi:hypothetical protein